MNNPSIRRILRLMSQVNALAKIPPTLEEINTGRVARAQRASVRIHAFLKDGRGDKAKQLVFINAVRPLENAIKANDGNKCDEILSILTDFIEIHG